MSVQSASLLRLGLSFLILFLTVVNGLAQSSVITTYVGPPLPVSGPQALTRAIDFPSGIAVDSAGGFYVASVAQNRVYRVGVDGAITLVAGSSHGFSGDGGRATSARLASPTGVAVDSAGNLYIADTRNNRVRRVSSDGVITTVAGNGAAGFSGDGGPATSAQLSSPNGVAVDGTGNLYIADGDNKRVRKVSAGGVIGTVAGSGTGGVTSDGVPATSAQLV